MGNQDPRSRKICLTCLKQYDAGQEICPDDSTLLRPIADQLQPGDTFVERYEIVDLIGDGGWGKVYKARHKLMKRFVAIKMLLPHLVSSPAALKRFQHEAQAASALNHPNILTVYDFGISDQGLPYLVMDFLEGTSLAQVLQEKGNLTVERALPIFLQACVALSHAHQKGVIHRDIKPPNIMLVQYEGQPDFLKLVDFGIAKIVSPDKEGEEQLTSTGEIFGSPMYMSPEQCRGRELDARSDIYSLGCVLFRTVAGKPPFLGRDPMECMFKQVHDQPPTFESVCPELQLPSELEAIVQKAMDKDPDKRFQDMNDFRETLDHLRKNLSIAGPKPVTQVYAIPPGSDQEISGAIRTAQFSEGADKPAETEPAQSADPQPVAKQEESTSSTPPAQTTVRANPTKMTIQVQKGSPMANIAEAHSLGLQTQTGDHIPAFKQTQTGTNESQSTGNRPVATPPAAKQSQKALYAGIGTAVAVLLIVGFAASSFMKPQSEPGTPLPPKQENAVIAEAKKDRANFDYEEAEKKYEQALVGATPEEQLIIKPALGEIYFNGGQWDQSRKILEEIMPMQRKALGVNSAEVAKTQTYLALALIQLDEIDKADGLLQSSKQIFESGKDDEHHSGYSDTLYGLAVLATKEGDQASASKLINQALSISKAKYGDQSEEAARYLDALAQIYILEKQYDKAVTEFKKALAIDEHLMGPESMQTAGILKNLGLAYFLSKNHKQAEKLFKQALAINNKQLGADSIFGAEVNAMIGLMYMNDNRWADAEPYMAKALAVRTKTLGASSPKVQKTQGWYDTIKARLKRRRG